MPHPFPVLQPLLPLSPRPLLQCPTVSLWRTKKITEHARGGRRFCMNKKKKKEEKRATANIPVSSAFATANIPVSSAFWPSRFPPLSGSPVGRPTSSKGLHGVFPWPEPLPASSPARPALPPCIAGLLPGLPPLSAHTSLFLCQSQFYGI